MVWWLFWKRGLVGQLLLRLQVTSVGMDFFELMQQGEEEGPLVRVRSVLEGAR